MKEDTKILRGEPNRAVPSDVLRDYVVHLANEVLCVTSGEVSITQAIIQNWRIHDGVYEIVFSARAIKYLKATDDPRSDMVDTLFAAIGDEPVTEKKSQGWFAGVKSPIGALTTPMTYIWFACTIAGPLLTFVDSAPVIQLGKYLMMMSFGYLLFGLGLQRKSPPSAVQKNPKGSTART
ncbi:hypothetical protein ACYSUW_14965 [Pseudomonas frederiksbergensis]